MIYQRPVEEIASLIDVPAPPVMSLSPDNQWILLLSPASLPSIADLAQPELRLAGIRINPHNNGKSRASYYVNIQLKRITDQQPLEFTGWPSELKIGTVSWAPDASCFAFTCFAPGGIELWLADLKTRKVKRILEPVLNDALYGNTLSWQPDAAALLLRIVSPQRGMPPPEPLLPSGPIIQENNGTKAPVRTYQDLLKNPWDEALFEYYGQSVLARVHLDGHIDLLTAPCIISSFSSSPNGHYILLEKIMHPFSYLVPYDRFATRVEIISSEGTLVKCLADLPPAEDIPKGFSSVKKGPRDYEWRADAPAEMWWAEALDEGDSGREAAWRDRLWKLPSPFTDEPIACMDLSLRYDGISWYDGKLAIVDESWWDSRRRISSRFAPEIQGGKPEVLYDRSFEDSYNDPGYFMQRPNRFGKSILFSEDQGKTLYLTGQGSSPEGDRPFLDRIDVQEKKTERLWRSEAPWYEYPYFLLDTKQPLLLTRRESVDNPPNFFLRDLTKQTILPLSDYADPYPQMREVKKEMIRYQRADGLPLTATLYLPHGDMDKNRNLPVLMWAYPQEFKSADAAGQVKDSPYRFSFMSWASPLFWLARGFAILDDPSLPIIGEGEKEPNDTYIEQLVSGAKAAIDTLVERGVADPQRVAIGGHSYGAFMTANLMVHSDLFAAGIARSGAYNRTLTPFGFQAEERTIWEAPDTYMKMSPFMYADKLTKPLLLIHGEADNNSGTFPMQSERFFAALKGHGATTRLVLLPYESHGYKARESILHMLWEMDLWLEKYVKERS